MKAGKKIKSSTRSEIFKKGQFKFDADLHEFKAVIKALNTERCKVVLQNDEGLSLPNSLGRLIILGTKPRVKNLYSMTRPGHKITNLHSFGWVYRVFHKERIAMRYGQLYKFRPHRENIKQGIHDAVVNHGKSYLKHNDLL